MEKSVTTTISNKTSYISLNCPVSGNLMCSQMLDELYSELDSAEKNVEVNLIIIKSGQEGVFSKGHNIEKLQDLDHIEAKHYNMRGQKLIKFIRSMKKPTLTLIDGDCFGSAFELALASDIVFATEGSKFAFPEVEYGFIPGFGGTQLAARKTYETFVKYLVFTGDSVSSKELFDKGIVSKMFNNINEMDQAADNMAKHFAGRSAFAIGLAKETINNTIDMDFHKGLLFEQNAFTFSFSTKDKHEGTKAFVEKRNPEFSDRWEDFQY